VLTEAALRHVDAAYVVITAAEFWSSRMVAVLNQVAAYRRHYAEAGQPVDTQPVTLTGQAWREAMDRQTDDALDTIY
jgi:hypothetical protein